MVCVCMVCVTPQQRIQDVYEMWQSQVLDPLFRLHPSAETRTCPVVLVAHRIFATTNAILESMPWPGKNILVMGLLLAVEFVGMCNGPGSKRCSHEGQRLLEHLIRQLYKQQKQEQDIQQQQQQQQQSQHKSPGQAAAYGMAGMDAGVGMMDAGMDMGMASGVMLDDDPMMGMAGGSLDAGMGELPGAGFGQDDGSELHQEEEEEQQQQQQGEEIAEEFDEDDTLVRIGISLNGRCSCGS